VINICIPTLNNYTGLVEMINSINAGSLVPDNIIIVDNGGNLSLDLENVRLVTPGKNLGVAGSWNYFLKSTPEVRIICNDDLIFHENTLRDFMKNLISDKLCYPENTGINAFSFFYIPDEVVSKVGNFDEGFYPAYFEDNDYVYRMGFVGEKIHGIECSVTHVGSQTMANYNANELEQHHQNFRRNRAYYLRKWGGLPTGEVFMTPFSS